MENRPSKLHWGSFPNAQYIDAQVLWWRLWVRLEEQGKGKGRVAVDALALGHVTTSGPVLVGYPWRWGSLCSVLHLAKLAGSMKSALICPFRLQASFAAAFFLLLPVVYLRRKPQVLSPVSVGTHSFQNPVYTYASSCIQRQSVCLLSSQAR